MRRMAALTVCVSLALGSAAVARVAFIPPPPAPARLGQADLVVVGRVVGIEPTDVEIKVGPGDQDKIKFRIAVVSITENITGAKGMKTVRVGFPPPQEAGKNDREIRIRPRPGLNPDLKVGLSAVFFLTRQGSFYVAPELHTIVPTEGGQADGLIKEMRQLARSLENPRAGLKSDNKEERLKTAALLIHRYRTFRGPGPAKEEPIPAEESKLILQALAEVHWAYNPRAPQESVYNLFLQLNLTPKDGWDPRDKVVPELVKEGQEWVRKHAETYRIRRFVAGKRD